MTNHESFESLILTFLDYLTVECGLSDNTIAAYRNDLFKFLRQIHQRIIDSKFIQNIFTHLLRDLCPRVVRFIHPVSNAH